MTWTTTHDVTVYLAAAGDFLRSRPAEHTIHLTVADMLRTRGATVYGDAPSLFGWWREADGSVGAALFQTPPRAVQVTHLPDAAVAPLAKLLAGPAAGDAPPTAVELPRAPAEAFAAAWGPGARVTHETRLYRLGTLVPPDPAPEGRARIAGPADRDLLLSWTESFMADVGAPTTALADTVDDRLSHDGFVLWERPDGAPVSMASATRLIAGAVRIAFVYTPPEHRRHGYAGAVTAAASRRARGEGAAEVVLFTDLANPTSNAVYQRIGYRPVFDRVALELS
ncbi:GNAT family N-acetyltransferase [Streptomyces litchfieldiae]|uniref:GNAT family N-acetyltransferase n=1 Tax=Streptomyces litchfieldiae TaxID=3075543 RepID=A0ABU2MRN0_9ACTN|nr:GNAT family N-acetyltransferase [Streptomyces sp. DSM 44938]MDT0344190.1 GNAT family N-acetyltransferase [Streptomyces sp. DSM 44938]